MFLTKELSFWVDKSSKLSFTAAAELALLCAIAEEIKIKEKRKDKIRMVLFLPREITIFSFSREQNWFGASR